MATQQYENYWSLTVEYTDIHGLRFIETLRIIYNHTKLGNVNFSNLTNDINKLFKKSDLGSVRKSINQFIKLGFIEPNFIGAHPLTSDYLSAKTNEKRNLVFSNIFYSNAKLKASYSTNSPINEIKFFIKTLEEVGSMTYDDIAGIMNVDLSIFPNQYLTAIELAQYNAIAKANRFAERKNNQIGYLINFLQRMDDITYKNKVMSFENNTANIATKADGKRDNYLHKLYKAELMEESKAHFKKEIPFCMVEKFGYPYLIASHIKPFKNAQDDEQYDRENGILISLTLDSLFDKNKISFNANDGKIMISNSLDKDLRKHLEQYNLDFALLTPKRRQYLAYHNNCLK